MRFQANPKIPNLTSDSRDSFDFWVIWNENTKEYVLDIAEDFYNYLFDAGVHTVEELVEVLFSFPSGVAKRFEWRIFQIELARADLCRQLKGYVSDHFLVHSEPPELVVNS